ncbi:uncharacterized protein BDW70DRAFT_93164 [Aspergillus foveolatus]|uniref:uncharacterized protein n=1 Tax=Aspergillus foveolatus TaxID=210207 RepID=UPI003CCD750E
MFMIHDVKNLPCPIAARCPRLVCVLAPRGTRSRQRWKCYPEISKRPTVLRPSSAALEEFEAVVDSYSRRCSSKEAQRADRSAPTGRHWLVAVLRLKATETPAVAIAHHPVEGIRLFGHHWPMKLKGDSPL